MRRSNGTLMLVATLLAGCSSQAGAPVPTPLMVYVFVTPAPTSATMRPDPTPLIIYVTPAPTATSKPTPEPTAQLTAKPTAKPTARPTAKPITFTVRPSGSESWSWSPYFYLNAGAFTIHYKLTGEAYCNPPEGYVQPKGVPDDSNGPDNQRTYWVANLSCESGSKDTDIYGNRLKLPAGDYHMWLLANSNTLTITITQP